jgi:hypothetical protein
MVTSQHPRQQPILLSQLARAHDLAGSQQEAGALAQRMRPVMTRPLLSPPWSAVALGVSCADASMHVTIFDGQTVLPLSLAPPSNRETV